MTKLQTAQISELEARLAGYRKLADVATTNEERQWAIIECKVLIKQITAIRLAD